MIALQEIAHNPPSQGSSGRQCPGAVQHQLRRLVPPAPDLQERHVPELCQDHRRAGRSGRVRRGREAAQGIGGQHRLRGRLSRPDELEVGLEESESACIKTS